MVFVSCPLAEKDDSVLFLLKVEHYYLTGTENQSQTIYLRIYITQKYTIAKHRGRIT